MRTLDTAPGVRDGSEVPATIRLLGPVRVDRAGVTVSLRPAQRRLLAILSLAPERELTQEELVDRMWGEGVPSTARTSLQMHVSGLRKSLPGVVLRTADGYRLDGIDDDRAQAMRLALEADDAADRREWGAVVTLTDRALALWYGVPLTDLPNDGWATPEIRRLEELRSALVDRRIRALVALGRHADVAQLARRELAEDPLREARWHDLILALARDGKRAEALRAYREAADALLADVGVEPGAPLKELERRIRFEDPDLGGAGTHPSAQTLPNPASSFVARTDDLARLDAAIATNRVTTVVGAPGVGKTRLAIEAALLALDRYPDGVWFVPLAAARTERDVLSAITTATTTERQLASLGELAAFLARRRALVILDNCEQVLAQCRAFVEAVLANEGPLRLLATSRRPLGIPGQPIQTLSPLELPATGPRSATEDAILATPSVRLFIDRARAADPTFRVTPQSLSTAAAVCRSTGGVPLAIELTASWLPAIGVADLREILGPSLSRRGEEPAGGREASSLREAIDRSTSLLPPSDLRLLRDLAAFAGSFSLADVRAVCAPEAALRDVAAEIGRLVDASLLIVERRASGRAIYRLLVPIREYLLDLPSERAAAVRSAFVEHYLARARAWCPDPMATGSDLEALDDDMDNIREALDVRLTGDGCDDAGWSILALHGYFYDRYLVWEGIRWISRALERVRDPELRAWLLRARGSSEHNVNDLDAASRTLSSGLRVFRRLKQPGGAAMCLLSIAQLHATRGSWALCGRAAGRARRLLGPDGNRSGHAIATYYIGESVAYAGETAPAIPLLAEAGRLFQETNQLHRSAYALATLTMVAVLGRNERAARRHGPRAVELARRSSSGYRLTRALGAMAACEAMWGDPLAARGLLTEAQDHLGPIVSDTVVDFILPAGFAVARWGQWDWLMDSLAQVEAAAAGTTIAISVPWRRQLERWRREATERGIEIDQRRVFEPMAGEELVSRTLDALAGDPPPVV